MSSVVDEFENSFQCCVTALTSPTTNFTHDPEEVKTSADQTVQRFLESAKAMECFFLQKRLYLSVHRPEQLIREEIEEIKGEIQRKDQVIGKFQEKLVQWQSMLSDQPQTGLTGHPLAQHMSPAAMAQVRGAQIMPQQQVIPPQQMMHHSPQPIPRQHVPPNMIPAGMSRMPQMPGSRPHYSPEMGAGGPAQHYMPPAGIPQVRTHMSPAAQQQLPPQQQQQLVMQSQQQQQPQPSPLAYLERTTSNIGMGEMRR